MSDEDSFKRGTLRSRDQADTDAANKGPPTHPSFRLLGSRTSTPRSSPGRFRSRSRSKRRASEPPPPPATARDQSQQQSEARAAAPAMGPEVAGSIEDTRVGGGGNAAARAATSGGGVAGVTWDVDGAPHSAGGEGAVVPRGAVAPEEQKGEEEDEEPEAVVAASVTMSGLLECGRAMRMDGKFVGELTSTGRVTVGPTGSVTGDLKGLKFLRVEGQVIGDVVCDEVVVVQRGKVFGDITAVSLTVGPQATMRGKMNVVDDMSTVHAEYKPAGKAPPATGQRGREADEVASDSASDEGMPDLIPMTHSQSQETIDAPGLEEEKLSGYDNGRYHDTRGAAPPKVPTTGRNQDGEAMEAQRQRMAAAVNANAEPSHESSKSGVSPARSMGPGSPSTSAPSPPLASAPEAAKRVLDAGGSQSDFDCKSGNSETASTHVRNEYSSVDSVESPLYGTSVFGTSQSMMEVAKEP